jgi:hypothetical protein
MTIDPADANPLHANPLLTRADIERALHDLFAPLRPHFSPGGARVRLNAAAATFDRAAADLEGFARPLWGLAPLAAGGGELEDWEVFRRGLANGSDPAHPEYWGTIHGRDQRMVEMAPLGFALRLIPELVWEPLPAAARKNLAAYMRHVAAHDHAPNNWKFFRIFVDLGLRHVGEEFDQQLTDQFLDELEAFYLGEGWYRDGKLRRVDHYVAFAIHFYSLIYAELKVGNDEIRRRYRERATLFARDFINWFDEDGGTLAFGRSMTYRFACASFWGALAFAGVDALPWGVIKGLYLRHLRWWARRPIADRGGILSVGYGYPNLFMSESYNSAGSPYWAFKAFLPLALPETHPFWQAEEQPLPARPATLPLRHPGMVMMPTRGNVVALSSGQENLEMRFGAEKYSKFAYSSRYGFSVEADDRNFSSLAADNMLALSDDGRHYRVRETNEVALIAGDRLFARWRPWSDVAVETWLVPAAPWHIRIHRINTPRPLQTTEGGFAISRADGDEDHRTAEAGRAEIVGKSDRAAIVDLSPGAPRTGHVQPALPNTNLIDARTWVPQLRGAIPAGTTVLAAAVLALPTGGPAAVAPPPPPELAELERLFDEAGIEVSAIFAPTR